MEARAGASVDASVVDTSDEGDPGVGTGADHPYNGGEQPDRKRGQVDGGKGVGADSAYEEGVDEIKGYLKKHPRRKRDGEFE